MRGTLPTVRSHRSSSTWPSALWVGALGLAGLFFLLGIGAAPLIDRDEPAYAEAAREMLARGDWLVTWFNGRPWIDKPPLVFWCEMVSYRALGVNETAARLPVALFGVAGLLALYWVGRRLRPDSVGGAIAAAVLATSLLYFGLSRAVLLDVPFTACFVVSMGALVAGIQEPQRARWPLLAGAALGLAVLAKSPAACVLFAAVLVGVGLAQRSPLRARGLRWGWTMLACAAVAAPWYVAMTARLGPEFLHEFLGAGNVGRFVRAEHTRSITPFYYLPIIVVGFLPWTAALPGSLRTAWRERSEAAIPLLWAGITFVFFSAAQSKLPGYILPMFPALALLVGLDLDRRMDERGAGGAFRGVYCAAGSTLLLAAGVLAWSATKQPRYLAGPAMLACLGLLPLGLVIQAKGRATAAAGWTIALAAAAAGLAGYGLMPALARDNSTKEMARLLAADRREHRIHLVNTLPLDVPSLLFYTRQTAATLDPRRPFEAGPGDALVVRGALPAALRQVPEPRQSRGRDGGPKGPATQGRPTQAGEGRPEPGRGAAMRSTGRLQAVATSGRLTLWMPPPVQAHGARE